MADTAPRIFHRSEKAGPQLPQQVKGHKQAQVSRTGHTERSHQRIGETAQWCSRADAREPRAAAMQADGRKVLKPSESKEK